MERVFGSHSLVVQGLSEQRRGENPKKTLPSLQQCNSPPASH